MTDADGLTRLKVLALGWTLSMIPVAVTLAVYVPIYWYFEVRVGGSWFTLNVIQNLRWVPVFLVLYVVSVKGLEIVAGYVIRNHRDRLVQFKEWYW